MYCKECGTEFASDDAKVCLNCGVKRGNGKSYCEVCGSVKKSLNQDICLNCGADFKVAFGGSSKIKLATLLLWFFLGGFGGHCFYVGKTGKGIMYIGLFALNLIVGWLVYGLISLAIAICLIIDVVQILTGKFTDGDGKPILNWT